MTWTPIYTVKNDIINMCKTLFGKYLVSIMLHYYFPLHTVVLYSYVHLFKIVIIYYNVFYSYGNQFIYLNIIILLLLCTFIYFMVILLIVIISHIYEWYFMYFYGNQFIYLKIYFNTIIYFSSSCIVYSSSIVIYIYI